MAIKLHHDETFRLTDTEEMFQVNWGTDNNKLKYLYLHRLKGENLSVYRSEAVQLKTEKELDDVIAMLQEARREIQVRNSKL